jgi:hypothetical protein
MNGGGKRKKPQNKDLFKQQVIKNFVNFSFKSKIKHILAQYLQ